MVWSASPKPAYFTAGSIASVLFGIPWTAFSIFWTVTAAGGVGAFSKGLGWHLLFPMFGIPFVLIGFGMLSAPIFESRRLRNTFYVITNKRAILFEGKGKVKIRSFAPNKLTDVFRLEKADGSGDVIFREFSTKDSDNDTTHVQLGFLRVPNVRDVEQKLRALARVEASRKEV